MKMYDTFTQTFLKSKRQTQKFADFEICVDDDEITTDKNYWSMGKNQWLMDKYTCVHKVHYFGKNSAL